MKQSLILLVVAWCGILSSHGSAAVMTPVIQHTGDLGGSITSVGRINDSGVAAGFALDSSGSSIAYRWTIAGGMVPLWSSGISSGAESVNAAGDVVGYVGPDAYRWPMAGGAQNLGTLGGSLPFASGNAINDLGLTVGYSRNVVSGNVVYKGFQKPLASGMASIGTLPGSPESYALDVNNAGKIVGWSGNSGTLPRYAILYEPGVGISNLNVSNNSEATAINESNVIVGFDQGSGTPKPFVKLPAQPVTPLGLGSASGGYAWGINDNGVVVGSLATHAAMWVNFGTPIDLDVWLDTNYPSLGANWTLGNAACINNNGLISGQGTYNDGFGGLADGSRAFVLDASSAIPEPSAALAAVLLAGAISPRRRVC